MDTRYKVQHEFDHEPTYIVDSLTWDEDIVVEFPPVLPWEQRLPLARRVADELNEAWKANG